MIAVSGVAPDAEVVMAEAGRPKLWILFRANGVPMVAWESVELVAATCGYTAEGALAIMNAAFAGDEASRDLWLALIDRTERGI